MIISQNCGQHFYQKYGMSDHELNGLMVGRVHMVLPGSVGDV
jgi:hypothetical protein